MGVVGVHVLPLDVREHRPVRSSSEGAALNPGTSCVARARAQQTPATCVVMDAPQRPVRQSDTLSGLDNDPGLRIDHTLWTATLGNR